MSHMHRLMYTVYIFTIECVSLDLQSIQSTFLDSLNAILGDGSFVIAVSSSQRRTLELQSASRQVYRN